MEIFECMMQRRSVRRYLEVPVEWDKIGKIINAGRYAPSAGNQQNWKFIVVLERTKKSLVSEACLQQYWMQQAAAHIIVCAEPQKARQYYGIRGERLYSIQNCSAAVQNMLLAATALGLGSCWIGAFDEDMLRRAVGIPDYIRPQAIVTIGYAAEKPAKPWKYRVYDIMYLEKWDRRIADLNWVMKDYSVTIENEAKAKAKSLAHHVKRLGDHAKRVFSGAARGPKK